MVGISETMCTELQGALVVQSGEGVGKSGGGTETENLFVALLAALSGGLLISQGELDVAVQNAVQDTQGDVAVEGVVAAGNAAPLPEGVAVPLAGGCSAGEVMASAEAAVADVAQVAATDQAPANVVDAAVIEETSADLTSVTVSDEMSADIANAAGNGQAISSEPVAGATGTADDQVTVVSVQHESPPDPDANSPPELLARVESPAQAEEAGSAAPEGDRAAARGPVARGSTAGVEVAPQGERAVELESGTRPVVSGEAEPAPSGPGTARVVAHSGGEENVPMGSGRIASRAVMSWRAVQAKSSFLKTWCSRMVRARSAR